MNKPQTTPARPPLPAAPARIRSEALFAGGRVLVIEHAGREYRLSVTAGNKLILTA